MQYADITDVIEGLKTEVQCLPFISLNQTSLDYLFNEAVERLARPQEDTMPQAPVALIAELKAEALLVVSGSNLQEGVTQRLVAVFDNAIAEFGHETEVEGTAEADHAADAEQADVVMTVTDVRHFDPCPDCKGAGVDQDGYSCATCKGTGEIEDDGEEHGPAITEPPI